MRLDGSEWELVFLPNTKDTRFQYAYLIFVFLLFGLSAFFHYSPIHGDRINSGFLYPAGIFFASIAVYRNDARGVPEGKALGCFFVWFVLSRILNGDYYLQKSSAYLYPKVLSYGVCFLFPFALSARLRQRVLDRFADLYSFLLGMVGWACLYAVATSSRIYSPFSGCYIGLFEADALQKRLSLFGFHPNYTACLMLIGILLAIFRLLRTKKTALRIAHGISILGMAAALMMADSRTTSVALCVAVGLLAMVALWWKNSGIQKRKRIAISILACLSAASLCFGGLTLEKKGIETLASGKGAAGKAIFTAMAETASEAETPLAQPTSDETVLSYRGLSWGADILSGRLTIYRSIAPTLLQRPQTLLIGTLDDHAMDIPNQLTGWSISNMHNLLLQILLLTGLPGLLLSLWFFVRLLGHSYTFCFRSPSAALPERCLMLIPFALLLISLLDVFIFVSGSTIDLLFFLLTGFALCAQLEATNALSADAARKVDD